MMKIRLKYKDPRKERGIARSLQPSTHSSWPADELSVLRKWLCENDKEKRMRTTSLEQTDFQSRKHGRTTSSPTLQRLESILEKVQARLSLHWRPLNHSHPKPSVVPVASWQLISKNSILKSYAVLLLTEFRSYIKVLKIGRRLLYNNLWHKLKRKAIGANWLSSLNAVVGED